MKKFTLEQLIEVGKSAPRKGEFGIDSCKREIRRFIEMGKQKFNIDHNLYELLGIYVERVKDDVIYGATMVYACWELINEL